MLISGLSLGSLSPSICFGGYGGAGLPSPSLGSVLWVASTWIFSVLAFISLVMIAFFSIAYLFIRNKDAGKRKRLGDLLFYSLVTFVICAFTVYVQYSFFTNCLSESSLCCANYFSQSSSYAIACFSVLVALVLFSIVIVKSIRSGKLYRGRLNVLLSLALAVFLIVLIGGGYCRYEDEKAFEECRKNCVPGQSCFCNLLDDWSSDGQPVAKNDRESVGRAQNRTGDRSGDATCTQEAKVCPDGSHVSRTGPDCQFASCPEAGEVSWRTYRSEKYGFEIGIPESCDLSADDLESDYTSGSTYSKILSGDNHRINGKIFNLYCDIDKKHNLYFSISAASSDYNGYEFDSECLTSNMNAAKTAAMCKAPQSKMETLKLNGASAYLVEDDYGFMGPDCAGYVAYVDNLSGKNDVYRFYAVSVTDNCSVDDIPTDELKNDLLKIVSTFRFTK